MVLKSEHGRELQTEAPRLTILPDQRAPEPPKDDAERLDAHLEQPQRPGSGPVSAPHHQPNGGHVRVDAHCRNQWATTHRVYR